MRIHSFGLLATAGLVFAAAFAQATQLSSEKQRLDQAIDLALREKRIVGTVVLVARDGKIVYRRAAGMADREANLPMRDTDVFRLASMSKQIVSVAALALIDQGKLSLDDPVTKWLPNFQPKLADGRVPTITVRHLLTHTAGLSYGFSQPDGGPYDQAGVSDGLGPSDLSMQENLKRIASVPLSFEPGSAWEYSVATDVLGEVIAKVTGKELSKAIEEIVTKPLGMSHTGFSLIKGDRLATPYANGNPKPVRMTDGSLIPYGKSGVVAFPSRATSANAASSGGAGILSTADDFMKFLESIRRRDGVVLKGETAETMVTNQVGNLMAGSGGLVWGFGFGVGILMDPKLAKSPQSVGTYRWGGVYGHSWFVDPKEKLTVVIMTNTATEGLNGPFTKWIRDALYPAPAN